MKKIFDNEIEIIDFFQSVQSSEILLLPENDKEVEDICLSVHDDDRWRKWIDSSGKGDPPPDFYCEELKLMMDVMRVDDHGHIGKNGKSIVNPTLQRESAVMRDLEKRGVLDMFPGVPIHLLVDTGLPTDEDHNYEFYRDNFLRTVKSHIGKIKTYQTNHPGFKTIFFIFDESSFYFETISDYKPRHKGEGALGQMHLWFLDKEFIKVFERAEIDYVIWFTPYKRCLELGDKEKVVPCPKVVVYNVKEWLGLAREYNAKHMVSSEL